MSSAAGSHDGCRSVLVARCGAGVLIATRPAVDVEVRGGADGDADGAAAVKTEPPSVVVALSVKHLTAEVSDCSATDVATLGMAAGKDTAASKATLIAALGSVGARALLAEALAQHAR